jgi:hypothetical protein
MRSSIAAALAASAVLGLTGAGLRADDIGGSQSGLGDDTWKIVLPFHEVEGVLGQHVTSSTGEPIGRIVQVLVDKTGRVQAAVIDFGGFLGVGSRKVVVQWAALHFTPDEDNGLVTLDLTPDQVKAAPEYKPGKPVVVLGALAPSLPEL